jgi:hypothetical protein
MRLGYVYRLPPSGNKANRKDEESSLLEKGDCLGRRTMVRNASRPRAFIIIAFHRAKDRHYWSE